MKPLVIVASGLVAVAAVAGIGHQLNPPKGKLFLPVGVRHTFPGLTSQQRQDLFKLYKAQVSNSALTPNPNATLITPQSPYFAPLDASLNALGTFQTATGWNRIIMHEDNNEVMLVIGKPDPTKTYLVTFLLSPSKPIQAFMLTGRTSTVNGTGYDPFQPNAMLNGPTSVPVMIMPGSNTAEVSLAVGDRQAYTTCEGVTVEAL
ncbi:MAG TPA: hypothetical protein VKT78_18175 [Fimbriimonadaceae bacterium]|nr:hypothetical protein [Fimbriimonadaceae bacterium]